MEENWMSALREACAKSTQAAVARQLGVSPSLLHQVLQGIYKGNNARVRTLVEGVLQTETFTCPVLGEVPKHKCLEHQDRDRKFATANPLKGQLYIACPSGCPHSKHPKEY